mgnify:CR=1 FL=1
MQTTFPRLLLKHASERPEAPAMREKEYGIWQTTTWAAMAKLNHLPSAAKERRPAKISESTDQSNQDQKISSRYQNLPVKGL